MIDVSVTHDREKAENRKAAISFMDVLRNWRRQSKGEISEKLFL
jgi:hypothetical protein